MVRKTTTPVSSDRDVAILSTVGIVIVLTAWFGSWAGLAADGQNPPINFMRLAIDLGSGDLTWSTTATVVLVLVAAAVSAVVIALALIVRRVSGGRTTDRAATYMASRRDVDAWTRKPMTKKARTLGVDADTIGLPIGFHMPSKARLWSSWEDMLLLVAGPRSMKSTSFTIPLTLNAPGALFVTENKRGVLDHTRGPRSTVGEVWVFDPQGVADEEPTWWWNPLSYVTDEYAAEKMAAQIAESSREPGRKDPYFDGEAVNLLHLMLLGCALAGRPITTVYEWLSQPTDPEPIHALSNAGYTIQAMSLEGLAGLSPKQRDGVYGTCRSIVGFLRNRQMMRWVTPGHSSQPAFSPADYVRSTDTLYALSKDGQTSAGPLVGALTLAIFDAAEAYATTCVGGRLPVPLVGLLDEAANVCRFKDLDSKYSHYGSRGIVLLTVLQSWAQGEEIWGQHGMEKLWSAANVRIYGGSVTDTRMLQRVSDLIGSYDHITSSASHGRGGSNRTRSVVDRPILSVAELGALPAGRAIVLASKTPAMLVKVVPWFKQDKSVREAVEDSLRTYEPTNVGVPHGQ